MNVKVAEKVIEKLCGNSINSTNLTELVSELNNDIVTSDLLINAALILTNNFPKIPVNRYHMEGDILLKLTHYNKITNEVRYDKLEMTEDKQTGNVSFKWVKWGSMDYELWQNYNSPIKGKLLTIESEESVLDIYYHYLKTSNE